MSRAWSFFDSNTGELVDFVFRGSARHLKLNVPAGCEPIAGTFDHLSHRIDVAALRSAGKNAEPTAFVVAHENAAQRKQAVVDVDRDRAARAALREIDLRSMRRLRALSSDPELAALEAEAVEIRKDVIRTPVEEEKAARSFVSAPMEAKP